MKFKNLKIREGNPFKDKAAPEEWFDNGFRIEDGDHSFGKVGHAANFPILRFAAPLR